MREKATRKIEAKQEKTCLELVNGSMGRSPTLSSVTCDCVSGTWELVADSSLPRSVSVGIHMSRPSRLSEFPF